MGWVGDGQGRMVPCGEPWRETSRPQFHPRASKETPPHLQDSPLDGFDSTTELVQTGAHLSSWWRGQAESLHPSSALPWTSVCLSGQWAGSLHSTGAPSVWTGCSWGVGGPHWKDLSCPQIHSQGLFLAPQAYSSPRTLGKAPFVFRSQSCTPAGLEGESELRSLADSVSNPGHRLSVTLGASHPLSAPQLRIPP